jgi:hypothetical protein
MSMNLYVWQGPGVLQDYYSGMIACLAPSLEAAYKLGAAESSAVLESMRAAKPEVTRLPGCTRKTGKVWACWGGG